MRWRSETSQQWHKRVKQWHRVFVFLPRKDHEHGYRMWMEFCLRRLSESHHRRWEYRPITLLPEDVGANNE